MHAALGLPLPERTVGLSAHDFLCGACRPRVLLTRAARAEGAPTVASRWLVRLETLLTGIDAGDAWQAAKDRGARHLAAARALTTPDRDVPRAERPRPSLPQGRRLETISVTDVEALIRDAYGVYAKRILDLKPLEPLGRPPDARERGNVLHKIVESFVRATLDWPGIDAARAIFAETVDLVLAEHVPWPDLARAWRARAARFQDWFLEAEDARRATGRPVALERAGQMAVDLPSGPVTLTAKADRIDVQHDGRARIYDYKSGAVPTDKQIKEGLNQQIHLQAAILAAGGFEDLAAMECAGGGYIGLKGSGDLGAYCISKAADIQLVRNLAVENGPHNVRVNAISPGLVRTDFARALWENPDILEKRTAGDPLRRIGEPEEIAGIAVYLAAQAGSFTTGQNFVIDGGSTIT